MSISFDDLAALMASVPKPEPLPLIVCSPTMATEVDRAFAEIRDRYRDDIVAMWSVPQVIVSDHREEHLESRGRLYLLQASQLRLVDAIHGFAETYVKAMRKPWRRRKSKGWRRHVRRMKAAERSA